MLLPLPPSRSLHLTRRFLLHACPVPSGTVVLLTDVTAGTLKRIGPYSVGRVIGQGTYGIVRVGRHQDTGAAARVWLQCVLLA